VFKNRTFSVLVSLSFTLFTHLVNAKIEPVIGLDNSMTYVFDQDREAKMFRSHADPVVFKIDFEITENLCASSYQKPTCHYKAGFSKDHLSILWTKHPDVSKIGKIVVAKAHFNSADPNGFSPFNLDSEFVQSTYANQFIGEPSDQRFGRDEIICDSYDWLGFDVKVSKKVLMPSWHVENMFANSQTGINENRTSSSAENVEFIFDNNKLILNHISKVTFANAFGLVVLLPGGTAVTAHVDQGSNNLCQISLSQNVASSTAGMDLDLPYKQNPNYLIYTYPQSIHYRQFISQFGFLLNTSPGVRVDFE
jgi:hypothetical protein